MTAAKPVRIPQSSSWWALAGVLGLIKLIVFVLDSNPQVMLGDSMSYLATAMRGWIPPDRSFLYGFLIYNLTTRARSLASLLAVQTFAGIVTSLLAACILVRFFRAPFRIAAAMAVLVAIEPQQLLYERFVLTESLSTAVFAGFVFLALEYVHSRKVWVLIAAQIAGVLLIALRMTHLPVVLAVTAVAPFMACAPLKGQARRLVVHLLIALSLHLSLHAAYREWNAYLMELPPAYLYADGFFLIATVSPLLTPQDLTSSELAPVLSRPLTYVAEDPIIGRKAELYADDGLVQRMKAAIMNDYRANVEARRIAYRVMRRDPAGVLRLAMQTYRMFYSTDFMARNMQEEAGMRELVQGQLDVLTHYHLDARGLPFLKTVTRQYYMASRPWFLVVLHSPIVLLLCAAIAARPVARRLAWMLALIVSLQVGTAQLLQVEPSTRYLHPTAVLFAVALGIIVCRALSRTENQTEDPV